MMSFPDLAIPPSPLARDRLLRAARNQPVDRPPVWMMRQAGRYLRAYRDLRQRYPSFRERSEIPDLAIQISMQPYEAFQPDGVILFSDILTPLSGMGLEFEILENQGPVFAHPIRSKAQIEAITPLQPEVSHPFIPTILSTLRQTLQGRATVLGFVGAPWTLATYLVEGKQSMDYRLIKRMAFQEPPLLHRLLSKLSVEIAHYAQYQIESGAEAIQLFDSWAGHLTPQDYATFALPYQQYIIQQIKAHYPQVPTILCVHQSAALLDLMAQAEADVIHLDWTVTMAQARQQLGDHPVQGNLDPCVLLGPPELIRQRTLEIIAQAGDRGHIMNLGQGILPTTPEENVRCFFATVQTAMGKSPGERSATHTGQRIVEAPGAG